MVFPFSYPALQEDERTLYDHPLTERAVFRPLPSNNKVVSESPVPISSPNLLPFQISLVVLIIVLLLKR
jgi:hypothetical protein